MGRPGTKGRYSGTTLVRKLEALAGTYTEAAAQERASILDALEAAPLRTAGEVRRLHEILCFLRAYSDDRVVLARVERMLAAFAGRADLRKHRRALADSGISGTEIHYQFFWPTASWLARRCPERLTIDWASFEHEDRLLSRLHLLALYGETPGLDELGLTAEEWLNQMMGPGETDAVFLIRRLGELGLDSHLGETFYDELGMTLTLAPGPDTPSRTSAFHPSCPRSFQTRPLRRERPKLPDDVLRRPRSVHDLGPGEGRRLVDLAREAMVTRSRDLDAFAYGDPRDVRMVEWEDGLCFIVMGQIPVRRLMLESVYGFLTFKNGVPIGYALISALFGSSEIAYNVFETFRGGESSFIYGRLLATVRHLFGADAFTIYPYQLGHENDEGLRSGAWWFYQKLGFRAKSSEVLRLMGAELKRMRSDPGYRSSRPVLKKLAAENVYYYLGRPRDDVIGQLPLGYAGLAVTEYLAGRFGAERRRAEEVCTKEAARLLGLRSLDRLSPGERIAWRRWSPLVLILPGIESWSRSERAALADVVRAKGGRSENEYVLLFDQHAALRRALLDLMSGKTGGRARS